MNSYVEYKSTVRNIQGLLGLPCFNLWSSTDLHPYQMYILRYFNEKLTLSDTGDHIKNIKALCDLIDNGNEILLKKQENLFELYERLGILSEATEEITEEVTPDTGNDVSGSTDNGSESGESLGGGSLGESSSSYGYSDDGSDDFFYDDEPNEEEKEPEDETPVVTPEEIKTYRKLKNTWSEILFSVAWTNTSTGLWESIKCNYAEVLWELEHSETCCRCSTIVSDDNSLYGKLVGNGSSFCGCGTA